MTHSKPALTISQSLIKMFLWKGNEHENVCYRKVYAQYVAGLRTEPTEANIKGLCFEDISCGTNNNKYELPRNNRTKKLTLSSERIKIQANLFKEWIRERGGIVFEDNSQVTIYKRWEKDPKVILSGKLDIFPVILVDKKTGEVSINIIDLKYTGDIHYEFGKFAWGKIEYMDHLQAIMYLYLVMNIDYELNDALNPGNKLREFTEHPNMRSLLDSGQCKFKYYVVDDKPNYAYGVFNYILKPNDFSFLHECIRKVVNTLREANEKGWPAIPSSEQCLGDKRMSIYECPFSNCSFRKEEKEI